MAGYGPASLIRDYQRAGVNPTADDACSWSMWLGYLAGDDGQRVRTWFEQGGAKSCHLHTSGHASVSDLRAFATAIKPKVLVPIHGIAWDEELAVFPPIRRLADGEMMVI